MGDQFDLVTHAWSPINDVLEGWKQQVALNNFSRSLKPGGYMIMDIPVGYEEDKLDYAFSHKAPIGMIEKSFDTAQGQTVGKPFKINEVYDIAERITRAGFRIINLSPTRNPIAEVPARWRTMQGNERMTLVLEKVREPDETLELALVGRSG